MSRPSFFVAALALALFAPRAARAIERCDVGGRSVNLDNGASTAELTGVVRCRDSDDGKPTREIPYVKGEVQGVEKDFRFERTRETSYRAGKRHGPMRELDANGHLVSETTYSDDRELGLSRTFHPNGKVKVRSDRREPEGLSFSEEWDSEGRLVEARCGLQVTRAAGYAGCPYRKESRVVTTYQSSGKIDSIWPLRDGLLEGLLEDYDRMGRKVRTQAFAAGVPEGLLTELNAEGKPEHELTFRAGKRAGPERFFFAEGGVAVQREWKGDDVTQERTYYQNGKPRSETLLGAGSASVKSFFDSGKVSFEGTYRAGEETQGAPLHPPRRFSVQRLDFNRWGGTLEGEYSLREDGTHRHWYEDGKPASEATYRRGELEGVERQWHPNGALAAESRYEKGKLTDRKTWNDKGEPTGDDQFFPDGSRKNPGR